MKSSSSKTDAPRGAASAATGQVLVGLVLRPHGLRGEIVVEPLSDTPRRFAPGSRLLLVRRQQSPPESVEVAAAHPAPTGLRLTLRGVTTREAAEALRGAELRVDREEVPAPPEGSFYVFELVGCRAFDARHGDLGTVVDLVDGPGGALIVVERPDGSRLPIPFVESFLVGVDREARRIDWKLPKGLLEACASRS